MSYLWNHHGGECVIEGIVEHFSHANTLPNTQTRGRDNELLSLCLKLRTWVLLNLNALPSARSSSRRAFFFFFPRVDVTKMVKKKKKEREREREKKTPKDTNRTIVIIFGIRKKKKPISLFFFFSFFFLYNSNNIHIVRGIVSRLYQHIFEKKKR